MDKPDQNANDHPALRILEAGEKVEILTLVPGADVLVTDRRLAVANEDRIALNVPFSELRRIQFDIERTRPATLVIVPERPHDEPQVLAIPPDRYDEITRALAHVGRRLAEGS